MVVRDRQYQFNSQLRKSNRQNMFRTKRLMALPQQLMTKFSNESKGTYGNGTNNFSLEELQYIAYWSKNQSFIKQIKQGYTIQAFIPYLDVNRPNREQFYATLIICNCFFFYDENISLSESALQALLTFMNSELDTDIESNCISILDNILQDCSIITERLMNNEYFIVALANKLEKYSINTDFKIVELQRILSLIYHILNKSTAPSVLYFEQPLSRLLTIQKNAKILGTVICCFNLLLETKKEQAYQIIQRNRLIERCIELTNQFKDRKIAFFSMQLIDHCKDTIDQSAVDEHIIPFLSQLYAIDFKIGETSCAFSTNKMKLYFLDCLLYFVLYNRWNLKYILCLLDKLKSELESTTSNQIKIILIKILIKVRQLSINHSDSLSLANFIQEMINTIQYNGQIRQYQKFVDQHAMSVEQI